METYTAKQALRKDMASRKKEYSRITLKPGPFGILEPKADGIEVPKNEIDLIIVPGVAFDKDKNRMGRGRGFYDRLLSTLNAPKVGICFGFQMIPQVPVEPLDKKMDYVITEDTIY